MISFGNQSGSGAFHFFGKESAQRSQSFITSSDTGFKRDVFMLKPNPIMLSEIGEGDTFEELRVGVLREPLTRQLHWDIQDFCSHVSVMMLQQQLTACLEMQRICLWRELASLKSG